MAEPTARTRSRATDDPAASRSGRTVTTIVEEPATGASRLHGFASAAHAILRIGAGLLFMEHGVQKLLGGLGGFGAPGNTAELFSLMGLAGVLELVGGALIVIGLLTRPVAVILVVEMIAAYFIQHLPQGGFPIENGGELALLYALVFLMLAATGAGPASVDQVLAKRRLRSRAGRSD